MTTYPSIPRSLHTQADLSSDVVYLRMKKDYTEDYIAALEHTLTFINQREAYVQKLRSGEEVDRSTYLSNIKRLDELIEDNRKKAEELKRLKKS